MFRKNDATKVSMGPKNRTYVLSSFLTLLFCAVVFLSVPLAYAQIVYTVDGGASTFSQTNGAWIAMQAKNFSLALGGGTIFNRFNFGGIARRTVRNTILSLGDSDQTIYMPTDIFMGGRSIFITGLGVDSARSDARTDLHLYVGGVSDNLQSQFFIGAQPKQAVGLFTFHGVTGEKKNWRYTTYLLASRQSTLLQSMEWSFKRNNSLNNVTLAASGGLAAMHYRYGAVSARARWHGLNFRAEYVSYPRIATPLLNVPDMQYGEAIKENVQFNYYPFRFLKIHGSRQNMLVFPNRYVNAGQLGNINTTDVGGITFFLLKTSLSGTYYDSQYMGYKSHGESVSIGRSVTRYMSMGANYSISHSAQFPTQRLGTVFLTERIRPQLNLKQTYVHTGQSSFMTFGGSYFTNRFSAGVNYNTTYVPTSIARPFQPNYSFNGSVKIIRRLSAGFSKSIDPYGTGYYMWSVGYSSYTSDFAGDRPAVNLGDFAVRGHVTTSDNQPVPGIAIMIDKEVVYSDLSGNFEVWEKKRRRHQFTVVPSLSTNVASYQVVSAPSTVESVQGNDSGITIVVKEISPQHGAAELYKEHPRTTVVGVGDGQAKNSQPAPDPVTTPAANTLPSSTAMPTAAATFGSYVPYKPATTASNATSVIITGQD
ncbi:MAG: hypothetical protein FWD64_06040 [Acidobacteriaceae bacterium]|nr:hypothetical protein [Acidobacteriaceae bacterium]